MPTHSLSLISSDPPYRDNLRGNLLLKQYHLEIDLRHVSLYNDELAHAIQDRPADILPLVSYFSSQTSFLTHVPKFENAATKAARSILFPLASTSDQRAEAALQTVPKIQITIRSGLSMQRFRDLTANTMNKLVRIPGIVISASVLSSRSTKLHLQCRACKSTKIMYPPGGLGGLGSGSDRGLPRVCDAPELENQKKDCPLDPYIIIHAKSSFVDQQTLKLQEAPDMVPVGELPRHILLSADRYLTGKVVPGSRIVATGIYSTFNSAKNVSFRYFLLSLYATKMRSRNLRDPPHSDNRIFAWLISSCPLRQQVLVPRTLSECSLHLTKKKTSLRWHGAKVSTNALQRV